MLRFPGYVFLLSLTAALMVGCGVGFANGDTHTEPLAGLRIVGTPVAGEELRLELDYEQTYPLAVEVECRVKQNGEVVQTIGSQAIPANPGGSPKSTPEAGTLVFPFRLEQPGDYQIECRTPVDKDNKISRTITVRG